jgi:hypothetical protein
LRLIVLITAGTLLLVLVATQLILPPYLEHRVEDRLTDGGGSASVTLSALPALRLLTHDGDKLEIGGHDLFLPVKLSDLGGRSLSDLDGFDEVAIHLERLRVDPFAVQDFDLTRPESSGNYSLHIRATTTPRALARYALVQLPGLRVPLFGTDSGAGERGQIPLDLDATLTSDDGRPSVVNARGAVAGLQVGPLVQLLASAVLSPI